MGLIWTLIIGLLAGIVAKLPDAGAGPGRGVHHHDAAGRRRGVRRDLPRPGGRLVPGRRGGFIGAVVGAVILLVIYRVSGNKGPTRRGALGSPLGLAEINQSPALERLGPAARIGRVWIVRIQPTTDLKMTHADGSPFAASVRGADLAVVMFALTGPIGAARAALITTEQALEPAAARRCPRAGERLPRPRRRAPADGGARRRSDRGGRAGSPAFPMPRSAGSRASSIGCRPVRARSAAVIGAAVLIFIVLLITDLLGLTDVFPFVRSR